MSTNWRRSGEEPDYRFTLANERTFLAWVRTGLAVLAGAVVLDGFGVSHAPGWVSFVAAIGLCGVAGVVIAMAYIRWRRAQIAMRRKEPLPHGSSLEALTMALLVLAGLGAAVVLIW